MVRPALLVLVLLLALPATATGPGMPDDGAASTPVAAPTTGPLAVGDVEILVLENPASVGFARPSLDVSTALSMEAVRARGRLDRYALEASLADAEGSEERRTRLVERTAALREDVAEIRAEERDLRRNYAGGNISTEAYVRGLARLHVRTRSVRATAATIRSSADDIPGYSPGTGLSRLEANLLTLEGPLVRVAAEGVTGERSSTRIYAESGDNGVVLAAVVDGRYIRETYLADRYDPDSAQRIPLDTALNRVQTLYASGYNSSRTVRLATVSAGVYEVYMGFDEGAVTTYLDTGTNDIFYEIQERRLNVLEPGPGSTTTGNGTTLVVNRTYPGGPLRVATLDAGTGDPVNATVTVGGDSFVTGEDGVRWTIAPRTGGVLQVSAAGPSGTVSTSVRYLSPRTVGTEG